MKYILFVNTKCIEWLVLKQNLPLFATILLVKLNEVLIHIFLFLFSIFFALKNNLVVFVVSTGIYYRVRNPFSVVSFKLDDSKLLSLVEWLL